MNSLRRFFLELLLAGGSRAAARQYVRKVSGYREPSKKNTEAFERAVDEIAGASRALLDAVSPPPA